MSYKCLNLSDRRKVLVYGLNKLVIFSGYLSGFHSYFPGSFYFVRVALSAISESAPCCLLLTGLSWLIFSKGNTYGHCILTDWHWNILRKLGETNLPETYTQYMFERMTGMPVQKGTALTITRLSWLLSLLLSAILVFRKYICERRLKVTD